MEPDQSLRGHLVIYVDGYKLYDKYAAHISFEGGNTISVPDRLVPPPNYEVGSKEWWEDGSAVGDNQRHRLCTRSGIKPLKRFHSYDAAVDFIFNRQKKHKDHRHTLVYVTKNFRGKDCLEIVRSVDDIAAAEARIDQERVENEAFLAAQRAATRAEYPYLELLQAKFGRSVGWTLSDLFKDIQEKGLEAVKAAMPRATYYRQIKRLRDAGLVI